MTTQARPVLSHYGLPMLTDLQQSLQQVAAKSQPLVLMVTLEGCAYCKLVRQNYLPEWLDKGLTILNLDMTSNAPMADEVGRSTTHKLWAIRQRIRLAPTLLWLGTGGTEWVERLQGVSSRDFYGAYLNERMAESLRLARRSA
jgi:thioredoxin-related protein